MVGGINMDLTVWVDHLAAPGETVRGQRIMQHPGGKGANQAVAIARAGAPVALVGRVGTDPFGDEMLRLLDQDGVDTRNIGRDSAWPTGVALICVDADGQNTVSVGAGANDQVTLDDLDRAAETIGSASFGVLNFEIPLMTAVEAARRFRRAGARVVLNLSPLYPPPEGLVSLVDVLVVNELEGAAVAGLASEPETVIARILAMGIPAVALTLGAEGVAFSDGDRTERVAGHQVTPIDPTAAGDSFLGTLVAELARGETMRSACQRANAAGALAVTRAGAQLSIPSRADVDAFLAEAEPPRG